MTDSLTFYRQPGVITEAGPYAGCLNGLPTGITDLCKLVQGLTIHIFWAERYGLTLPDVRKSECSCAAWSGAWPAPSSLDPPSHRSSSARKEARRQLPGLFTSARFHPSPSRRTRPGSLRLWGLFHP